MGRPKKSAPALHEPEDDFSQDVPDEEPVSVIDEDEPDEAPETNGVSGFNKTALIREAVAAGHEKPALGVAYIREKHGVDIDAKYFSIVKGKMGKGGTVAKPVEKEAAPTKTTGQVAQASAAPSVITASLLDDLKQLRQIKDRYGDDFQKIVDAIG